MSKALADTLQQPQVLVEGLLNKLEKLSGNASHDLFFQSKASLQLKAKIGQLGLDPNDTHEKELYWGLMHRFGSVNDYFEKTYLHTTEDGIGRIIQLVELAQNCVDAKKSWSIKPAVAKKILRANPPKNLMKQLGYRSLESMLKHEDVEVVLAVAHNISSQRWREGVTAAISKLSTAEYEEKTLRIAILQGKWEAVASNLPTISNYLPTGTVIVSPSKEAQSLPGLSMFVVLAQTLESLRVATVAARFPELNRPGHSFVARIGGAAITWSSLLFHLGKQHHSQHPELLEPYIMPEHTEAASISQRICSIHPMLNFWQDTEYLLLGRGTNQVSCNIVDVATNYANKNDFGYQTTQAGRSAYWNYLLHKYMQNPSVFDKIITDIEETLMPGRNVMDEMVPEFAELRSS